MARTVSHDGGRNETIPEKTVVFPEIAGAMNTRLVGATRFERATSTSKNTAVEGIARAKSDVVPADLARLIEAWGSLTDDDRRRIRAIVDGRQA
jgi:hypothetical protein